MPAFCGGEYFTYPAFVARISRMLHMPRFLGSRRHVGTSHTPLLWRGNPRYFTCPDFLAHSNPATLHIPRLHDPCLSCCFKYSLSWYVAASRHFFFSDSVARCCFAMLYILRFRGDRSLAFQKSKNVTRTFSVLHMPGFVERARCKLVLLHAEPSRAPYIVKMWHAVPHGSSYTLGSARTCTYVSR